jgi:predicted protein tyrosine phosphatase
LKNNNPNILFVCGRNKWRSPTAETIYKKNQSINVKSAGVSSKSKHQISAKDIEWADIILVMEKEYKSFILGKFRNLNLPQIFDLNIPDEYEYMNEELIDIIKKETDYILKNKFDIDLD